MAFLFICLLALTNMASFANQPKQVDIQSLLEETESIRLIDYPQFLKNISHLETLQDSFSHNQSCLFEYLKSYQISYDGQLDKAKQFIAKRLNDCKDINVNVRLNGLLANISAISGDYIQAVSILDKVISKLDQIQDKPTKYHLYGAAYLVYHLVNQADLSQKFADLMINENPPNQLLCKAKAYKYLATLKLTKQKLDNKDIQNTIDFCMNNKQVIYAQILLINWLSNQMEESESLKELNLILTKLLSYEAVIDSTQYKNIIGIKNSLLAQLYEKLNRQELAKKYALKAIQGSISIGETAQKIKALQVLINFYQNKGDYKESNNYLIKKYNSEKKYDSDEQAKLMSFQTVKHNNLANEYQIKALSQENKLLELQNQLAEKSKKNQRLLNILYATIFVFFGFLTYRLIKQQRKFKRLSEYDHMTMIYNRKGIKEYMEYLLPHAQKKDELVAYIIFDLDLFKRINDVYGHVVGDWVIKNTIKACKDLNNEKAVFARLGGEEFSIIINNSSVDEAINFAESCRKAIYAIDTKETGSVFQISASFGITTSELSGYDYNGMMNHADNALYYSKENGRNKITLYHPYYKKQ
jgi:diguanylate cyclase (GGDEF)-like protein